MGKNAVPLKLSVLDRLRENTGANTDLATLKRLLGRDLEMLLNTRRAHDEATWEKYPHCANSLLSYGLPDFSAISFKDPVGREFLQNAIRTAIDRHEKRLSDVHVELVSPDRNGHHLHFRVEATYIVHPSLPSVQFDAVLNLHSQRYAVQGIAA